MLASAGPGRCCRGRGSFPLLLPERRLPRPRQARARQPDGLRPLRQGQATSGCSTAAPASYRFSERKGTPLFGSQLTEEKAVSIFEHLAERNGVRATARLVEGEPQHRGPLRPAGRRPRPAAPRRARGFFPPRPVRSSSTRSGRSSSRSRSTATPTTRPTTNHGDWWDHVALDPESRLVLGRRARGTRRRERRGGGRARPSSGPEGVC